MQISGGEMWGESYWFSQWVCFCHCESEDHQAADEQRLFIAMWPWSWLLPRPARTNTKRSVMNSTSRVLLQKKRKQSAIFVALQPAETHVNPSVLRTGSSKSVLGFGTVRCHCRVLTSRRLQGFWWLLNRKPLHSTYLIIYPCILINIYLDIHIYP